MEGIDKVLKEIDQRILILKKAEEEFKQKNNTSGRLNAKTRREELQSFKNYILTELDS